MSHVRIITSISVLISDLHISNMSHFVRYPNRYYNYLTSNFRSEKTKSNLIKNVYVYIYTYLLDILPEAFKSILIFHLINKLNYF